MDGEGKRFSTNTEADGRFHSKWMNMMYPRLYLARNLLREDGVIFISIDDTEVDNLKKLCNEVFGEENFVANIILEKKFSPQNDAKWLSDNHDHILLFAKSKEIWRPTKLPRTAETNARYSNPDNDPRGPWASSDMTVKTYNPTFDYPIKTPSGSIVSPTKGRCWAMSKQKYEELVNDNRVWFGKDGNNIPRFKTFLSEMVEGIVPTTLWHYTEVGHNQEARQELKEIFSDMAPFDSPKPVRLINRMCDISLSRNTEIILDFFAGSGTTAHAVLDLNRQDNGNRKFILVQLPEPTGRDDYKTIADITKERVRRVIKKIKDEQEESLRRAAESAEKGIQTDLLSSLDSSLCASASPRETSSLDLGFKVFKLAESNFKTWNPAVPYGDTAALEEQLTLHIDHIKPGRSQEDILYEILLKSGFPLTTRVETLTLAGKTVYSIAEGAMLICLERNLTQELIKAIADKKPMRVVCLDEGFAGNDQLKTNAVQTMKAKGFVSFRTV